jgi:FlaA1/EpsC-like NDP-sugar epimerase
VAGPSVRVVLASTCKACDPETVYGASKLIAERMVLNAGGTVARFFNVVQSCGNVFELWRALPEGEPLPVTPCERYFITIGEAVALLLWAAVLPRGRYAVKPVKSRSMVSVAASSFPGRTIAMVPPRRGDRRREPLLGGSEWLEDVEPWLYRISSPHEEIAA